MAGQEQQFNFALELNALKSDINAVKGDVTNAKGDVEKLNGIAEKLDRSVEKLNGSLEKLGDKVSGLRTTRAVVLALFAVFGISGAWVWDQLKDAEKRVKDAEANVQELNGK